MNTLKSAAFWPLALLLILAGCGGEPPPSVDIKLPDFTTLVEKTAPAVVNISTLPADDVSQEPESDEPQRPGSQFEEWFRRFFEEDGGPQSPPNGRMPRPSLGSGFIISEDGYILTNSHVVGEQGKIIVKLNDKRQLVAELVGSDSYSDIALLKVDADDLPTLAIGDVANLKVGSWVVAIGSPFGFETSVTAGIVSAKRRSLAADQYVPFLQTDVAINPGNSGGPLFNLKGEVIGVNAQIYSRTGGYQGVSFAIPIDVAMNVADQLRDGGQVQRGWLGVQIQEVNRELAESFNMERPEGALVAQVLDDSPAQDAGFEAGDVIIEFDGKPVNSAAALPPIVGLTTVGESVPVIVLRNGNRKKIKVEIGKLDADESLAARGDNAEPRQPASTLGMQLKNLRESELAELDIEGGVRVTGVDGGPAGRAGLRPGDIIVALGNQPVDNAKTLRKRLKKAENTVALLVRRDGNPLFLALDPSE